MVAHFINSLRPRRNRCHFADAIFKCNFLERKYILYICSAYSSGWILFIFISLCNPRDHCTHSLCQDCYTVELITSNLPTYLHMGTTLWLGVVLYALVHHAWDHCGETSAYKTTQRPLLYPCLLGCFGVINKTMFGRGESVQSHVITQAVYTSYQATSEGVLHVKFLAKVNNLNFWQFFLICNFHFCLLLTWDLMWITSMGNHGAAGVSQNAGILVLPNLFALFLCYI